MTDIKQYLPVRKTADGERIDTRPLYVEEWLDSLPYIDFDRTSRIIEEATRATNQETLKPATRLELIELYSRPYLFYVESQIRTGAQHTLQSMETMQSQIDVLRRIAVNLSYAARLAAEESLKKKTLWRKSQPPLSAMFLSMNFLSHALVFSFQEYAPTPRNVWRELHFIYDFAAGLSRENTSLAMPSGDTRHNNLTIDRAYKRILLATLADPYHLPFGAIWEIFEQLYAWTELTTIGPFEQAGDPAGRFVVNLDRDAAPIPYNKFNVAKAGDRHRLLDTTALVRHIDKTLAAWSGKPPAEMASLSPFYARLILGHLSRSWGLPPKRSVARSESSGSLEIAYGVNAAHYFFNGEQPFRPPAGPDADEIIAGETHYDTVITQASDYPVDKWDRIDQGKRGVSLVKQEKPAVSVRVGELITLMPDRSGPSTWSIGVIRWFMARQGGSRKTGIEILCHSARPAAVRARSGSELDRRWRQCLLIPAGAEGGSDALIVAKGLYVEQRELEISTDGNTSRVRAGDLVEATVAFEYFSLDRS